MSLHLSLSQPASQLLGANDHSLACSSFPNQWNLLPNERKIKEKKTRWLRGEGNAPRRRCFNLLSGCMVLAAAAWSRECCDESPAGVADEQQCAELRLKQPLVEDEIWAVQEASMVYSRSVRCRGEAAN